MRSNRKIVIVPDKFKGSLTAVQVADCIEVALRERLVDLENTQIVKIPLADGGDGSLDVLAGVLGDRGEVIEVDTFDPLMRPMKAPILFFEKDGVRQAFIEMAKCSGLVLLSSQEQNPERTTTFGLGVMMRRAIDLGAERLVLGIGGSATNDGGLGLLEGFAGVGRGDGFAGLGRGEASARTIASASPRNDRGCSPAENVITESDTMKATMPPVCHCEGGAADRGNRDHTIAMEHSDRGNLCGEQNDPHLFPNQRKTTSREQNDPHLFPDIREFLRRGQIIVACDVENPLLGPNGATMVYGPQKGADREMLERLEERMIAYAEWAEAELIRLGEEERAAKFRTIPGGGAAGGVGAALYGFFGAELVPGWKLFSDMVSLEEQISDADAVITAEGRFDSQSLSGKLVGGVASLCKAHKKRLYVVCGQSKLQERVWKKYGIADVYTLSEVESDVSRSIANAEVLLSGRQPSVEAQVGCDEAGRGCLAGSVFAAAVVLPKGFYHPLLGDSKQLTEHQRDFLRELIEREAIAWSVQSVSAAEIDQINILNASIKAMHLAVADVQSRTIATPASQARNDRLEGVDGDIADDAERTIASASARNDRGCSPAENVIIESDTMKATMPPVCHCEGGAADRGNRDHTIAMEHSDRGNRPAQIVAFSSRDNENQTSPAQIVAFSSRDNENQTSPAKNKAFSSQPTMIFVDGNRFKPYGNIPHHCIVKGDSKMACIAAASILAKTHRDEYMRKIAKEYPQYGWDKNMAYPTADHRAAIKLYGPSPYHRLSYKLLPDDCFGFASQ